MNTDLLDHDADGALSASSSSSGHSNRPDLVVDHNLVTEDDFSQITKMTLGTLTTDCGPIPDEQPAPLMKAKESPSSPSAHQWIGNRGELIVPDARQSAIHQKDDATSEASLEKNDIPGFSRVSEDPCTCNNREPFRESNDRPSNCATQVEKKRPDNKPTVSSDEASLEPDECPKLKKPGKYLKNNSSLIEPDDCRNPLGRKSSVPAIMKKDARLPKPNTKIRPTGTAEEELEREQWRLRRELDYQLQAKGLVDPDTALAYKNLADSLKREGITRFDEAMELYQQALKIEKEFFGDDSCHPQMGSTYFNIGYLLFTQGVYKSNFVMSGTPLWMIASFSKQAMQQYQKALRILSEAHGPEHPEVGVTYHEMGNVLRNQGKYDESMQQFEKAQEIFQKALGHSDEWTVKNSRKMESLSSLTRELQATSIKS